MLTQPIRLLIVEDDPAQAELLALELQALGYEPLGPAPTVAEAQRLFRQEAPDLLLMDIGLQGEHLDGIALAAALLREQPTPLIFLTSFDDAATFARARAAGPAAYLTKPAEPAQLQRAIELALQHFVQPDATLDEPLLALGGALSMRACLFVRDRAQLIKIYLDDILWLEANEKYSTVHTTGSRYALRMPLRELALEVAPDRFVQVHRSYIVQADRIEAIEPALNVLTVGGHELPLGRSYKEALLQRLRVVG